MPISCRESTAIARHTRSNAAGEGSRYAGLGDSDQAIERLRDAVRERTMYLTHTPLRTDPKFELPRGDPRFVELLRKIGL